MPFTIFFFSDQSVDQQQYILEWNIFWCQTYPGVSLVSIFYWSHLTFLQFGFDYQWLHMGSGSWIYFRYSQIWGKFAQYYWLYWIDLIQISDCLSTWRNIYRHRHQKCQILSRNISEKFCLPFTTLEQSFKWSVWYVKGRKLNSYKLENCAILTTGISVPEVCAWNSEAQLWKQSWVQRYLYIWQDWTLFLHFSICRMTLHMVFKVLTLFQGSCKWVQD